MAKCINCNIEILDETQCCPLCRSVLAGGDELENMYPDVRFIRRRLALFSRIYLFCAILLQSVLVGVNVLTRSQTWWSAVTGLGLLCGYLILRYTIMGKADYKNKIFTLALIVVLLSIASDFITGYRGWSLDYVLPGGILVVDAIILGCMIFNYRNWQSYIMWQLFMILCSLFPAGLFLAGLEHNGYIAFLPLAASLFLFAGTMIIGDRRAREELRRRFHVD